jgi:hypothetical protein
MYETLGRLRIADMFDIVVDFPDSAPAVEDMAECMRHTNMQVAFVAGVSEALRVSTRGLRQAGIRGWGTGRARPGDLPVGSTIASADL